MPNNILRILLNSDRGMLGELSLDLYENQLLAFPYSGVTQWSKFTKLRNLFK